MMSDKPNGISINTTVSNVTGSVRAKPAQSQAPAPAVADAESLQQKMVSGSQDVSKPGTDEIEPSKVDASGVSQRELAELRAEELKKRVSEAIPRVRELMQKNQRSLDFEVAEQENRVIITVIDKETDKVIRQIPPEDLIQIAESIEEGTDLFKGGSLLNSRV